MNAGHQIGVVGRSASALDCYANTPSLHHHFSDILYVSLDVQQIYLFALMQRLEN